jgi:hypothetical protein
MFGYLAVEKLIDCTLDGFVQLGGEVGAGVGVGDDAPSSPGFRHGHGSDSQ